MANFAYSARETVRPDINEMGQPQQNGVPKRMKSWDALEHHIAWLRPLLKLSGNTLIANRERYQQLADGLYQGDQVMETLLDWMMNSSADTHKQLFEQALQHGVDSVENCPVPLAEFFKHVDTTPDWLDPTKLDIAQQFIAATGMSANYILRDVALMGGYLLSGFNQTLIMTGALNKSASRRMAETSKWWIDCTTPQGLTRFGAGFKSTLQVRMIHALVRRNLQKRSDWQSEQWGLPINQIDMAATNLAFCSLFLWGLCGIGIIPNRVEADAVMHFWKYVGWLMGVDEQWLSDQLIASTVLLYELFQTQSEPDWTSRTLGAALSREPLEKTYASFQKLRQKYEYHKHLSMSRYFLGNRKMQKLGLPKNVLPWFPLLITPKNLLTFRLQRRITPLRNMQVKRGRRQQMEYLASFGKHGTGIIQPEQNHPAYVG